MKRLISLVFLCAAPLFAQQQPFGEKVEVNAVLVDAVVTDHGNHQILGLTKDDFVVKENGVEQSVDTLDYFTNRRLLNQREGDAPFKVENVREDRYFIFLFDKPSEARLFDQLALARGAARKFIDDVMQPTDRVAIATHDVRIKIYTDFTSDKAALRRALDESSTWGAGLTRASDGPAEGPSILRNIDSEKLMIRTGTVYEGLEVLADALRPIRARKELILFSPGIREQGEDVGPGGILLNTSRYYEPMIEALNAANVTVFPVNLQRDVSLTPVVHQTLSRIADETNGQYFRYMANYAPVVKEVEKQTNGYYLLTYTTKRPAGVKGYQKIDVAVKNPEFRVKARAGYSFGE